MKAFRRFLAVWRKVGSFAIAFQNINDMSKDKRVRISNERVNCYGTRILTSGIDLAQFERNPVLLYMHERGKVVGLVKDLKVEGQDVTGELVFDGATELSKQLEQQWEFGSLKMVSANFQILEVDDDESLALDGQTRATVTRSKLIEVSVVDIGGNDDAIRLCSPDGEELGIMKSCLPLLNNVINNPLKQETDMKLEQLALSLGLPSTATEQEVNEKIESLKLAQSQVENLRLAAIGDAVESAIKEKRIPATMKEHFVKLGSQVGIESLKITLSAMQPQVKLSQALHRTDSSQMAQGGNDFSKFTHLNEVPGSMMLDLHDNHHDEFVRLYKAEYGIEP